MGCRAIILAAGISSRIFELTRGLPKGLMEIGGEPVVGRIIRQLREAGVDDITLVVGYREDLQGALSGVLVRHERRVPRDQHLRVA